MRPGLHSRDITDASLVLFIATLFAFQALRSFLSGVYAMNVLTVGLNASVVAILLLLAPVLYLVGLARVAPNRLVPALALLFLVFRLVLLVPWPLPLAVAFGGTTVALYLLFLAPFLAAVLRVSGGAASAASAIALALAADLGLRILGNSADPGATLWAAAFLVPLGILFLYVSLIVPLPADAGEPRPAGRAVLTVGLGLGGFLALTTIVLSYPTFLGRWTAQPVVLFAPTLLIGFGLGGYLVRAGSGPARRSARWSAALLLGLALFLVDLSLVGTDVLSPLTLVAAVAAVVGLERLLGWAAVARMTTRDFGAVLVVAVLVLLGGLLSFVFSLTYAYVPLSAIWKGSAPAVLLLVGATFLLPAFAAGGRSPGAVPSRVTRRWTAVLAACLLLLGAAGIAVTPDAPVSAPGSPVLRVMTFNVHQGFGAEGRLDLSRIAEAVRVAGPDVLGLQESDTARVTSGGTDLVGYLASTLGYHAAYGPPTRAQTYGVAILSRLPILDWGYRLLASTGDQRALVWATLGTVRGDLRVFVVHLGLDPLERDAQVDEVLALAGSPAGPRLLLGDFNACPSGWCPGEQSAADRVYASVTATWADAWVASGWSVDDQAGFTYEARDPYERIDYVFASPELTVLGCEVVGWPAPIDASDHRGVLAEVLVP